MKILSITAKCSDMFGANYDGKSYDGYVPDWFTTARHYGDYVELEIDIDTGKILNWKTPTAAQLKETFDK